MTLAPERQRIVDVIEKTCADQARLRHDDYGFFRPQTIPATYVEEMKLVLDCSDYARFVCRASGVKDDPAGSNYAPFGNSSSIYFHLHHIDLADAEPGDIPVFGYRYGEKHASILYELDAKTRQWKVGNMGAQGQPIIDWLATEQAAHRGMTMTICRINVVDPPPTHDDELRAMTGFYAWMQWKGTPESKPHGEGPWKHYKAATKSVRPNVPRAISPAWWTHRTLFLLARKKGNKPA